MKSAQLRMAATFDQNIAQKYDDVSGLKSLVVVHDEANLLHDIEVEYCEDEGLLYRRLKYTMIHMANMRDPILTVYNDIAEQLLNKLLLSLPGSTISDGVTFSPSMLLQGSVWDDELPSDKPKPKAKPKAKKAQKATNPDDKPNEGDA